MKTIVLVRHAKSSHRHAHLTDLERPLNKRGMRDAPRMAERVASRAPAVDLIISSPAERARTTARIFAGTLGVREVDIMIDERLYHGNATDILRVIQGLEDSLDRVMVFGHNPDMTELANAFRGVTILNVPTCGVVELTFDIDAWRDVAPGDPVRLHFSYPKQDERA